LMSHHLVIGKAGGAIVQEAIAGHCPMIVNQVIPGQEEGNARLLEALDVGAVAESRKEVRDLVEEAFAHKGRLWQQWQENLQKISRPDAALRIAELVLEESNHANSPHRPLNLFAPSPERQDASGPGLPRAHRVQLCDFHIHTNYSDGRLPLPEVIDF